ncbi:MAG: AAA family ATPase [Bacteroidetes bacterium]|jgi:predicted ATP-dependent endonuclease of OLD family|nr:AAA family ATPase [Bacteroidota bacterium]MBT6684800.1 AAA family ATPase [Bacteroidota bacterium]MBT7141776.1 AAA family ATPase [Bacteroidota bacterium]MBT7490744.1 AAA family ATPase [Bacteroidota bacterium]
MKISIENLGPIKKFDFDIDKDFHIIYGENNIGKSYAISTVYILLKHLAIEPFDVSNLILGNLLIQDKEKHPELEKLEIALKNKILDKKTKEFSITKICENVLKEAIAKSYLPTIKQSFKNSFSNFESMRNQLSNKEFSLKIYLTNFQFTIKLSKNNELYISNLQLEKKILIRFINTNRKIRERENQILFYINSTNFTFQKLEAEILEFLVIQVFLSISRLKRVFNEMYFLPASRSGLYQAMNIFSSVFAKLSQIRHLVNSQIDIPALSEPVSDYFLKLSTIKSSKMSDKFSAIAKEIETEILDGEVIFNSDTKKIEFIEKKTKLKLDLSETSSMVSEISPIVAYLKYIINESDEKNDYGSFIYKTSSADYTNSKKLIFIEEPEAHLHPAIQVKLVEFFTKLIKNNIKIVLTTHSDFISNKLTNLILSKDLDFKSVSSCHLVMKEGGSTDSEDMKATKEGIEDFNFLKVAENLYEERIKLSNPENE